MKYNILRLSIVLALLFNNSYSIAQNNNQEVYKTAKTKLVDYYKNSLEYEIDPLNEKLFINLKQQAATIDSLSKKIGDAGKQVSYINNKENNFDTHMYIMRNHQFNMGKLKMHVCGILTKDFSSTEISKRNNNKSTKTFMAGDPIKATFFLPQKMGELGRLKSSFVFDCYIDGVKQDRGVLLDTENYGKKSSDWFKVTVLPSLAEANLKGGFGIAAKLQDLSIGEHYIILRSRFSLYSSQDAYIGFKINITADGKLALEEIRNKLNEEDVSKNEVPLTGLTSNFILSKSKRIVTKILKEGYQDFKMKSLFITSNDWFVERNNETGFIQKRSIKTCAILTDKKGKCYYKPFHFKQNYNGTKYSNHTVSGILDAVEIECEKINL